MGEGGVVIVTCKEVNRRVALIEKVTLEDRNKITRDRIICTTRLDDN